MTAMSRFMTRRHVLATVAVAPFSRAPLLHAQIPGRLDPPVQKVQAVIDTDTYNEIDDQYAVALALLSPDRLEVEATYAAPYLNARSVSPGDGMEKSYQELHRILTFLGSDPKKLAMRGSDRFLESAGRPVDSPAARDLIRRALKPRQAPLYVITLGAPTNVASAILLEPAIRDRIVVVWLGGTSHDSPSASEFNLKQDIHASRVLLDSGVALVQIPTRNGAERLRTTVPELERHMKGRSRLGDYLFAQFLDYEKTETKGKPANYPWSKVIWDISAVAWIINPKWLPSSLVPSPSLTDDLRWVQRPNRHQIRVITDVQRDAVFHDLFEKLAGSGK
jgi:purine nucleosidase